MYKNYKAGSANRSTSTFKYNIGNLTNTMNLIKDLQNMSKYDRMRINL